MTPKPENNTGDVTLNAKTELNSRYGDGFFELIQADWHTVHENSYIVDCPNDKLVLTVHTEYTVNDGPEYELPSKVLELDLDWNTYSVGPGKPSIRAVYVIEMDAIFIRVPSK